jgi:hypothetical protein
MDPLRQAISLAALETERANKLFPEDEQGAVSELLRRANELPDLRRAMLFLCALNLVRGEQMPGGPSDWLNVEVGRLKNLHSDEAEAIIELLHSPNERGGKQICSTYSHRATSRLYQKAKYSLRACIVRFAR